MNENRYKISSGYMGQVVEWPEVVTEGRDIEECRAMLRDALQEMVAAYNELGKEMPPAMHSSNSF
ncbi:MAG: type II toxin-antitoxin system HicB family antitoxin [Syntrophobacteraceae bacterium]